MRMFTDARWSFVIDLLRSASVSDDRHRSICSLLIILESLDHLYSCTSQNKQDEEQDKYQLLLF